MKNIAQINGGAAGSTGKIMFDIAKREREKGNNTFCACAVTSTNRKKSKNQNYYRIGTYYLRKFNVLLARITGFCGCFSFVETALLLRRLKKFSPDILWLHNLHESYINIPMLFRYIKKYDINVVWTLHDCWAFTGHCVHFLCAGCDKWKTKCHDCPQYRSYPFSLFDNSEMMFKLKEKWFTNVKNMTIITPSKWLKGLVKESFLRDYDVKVVNNSIDREIFKFRESNFRKKYSIPKDKYIVLGISFSWTFKKGIDVFCELSKRLDSNKYQIVLVGTNSKTDKVLPENIISIHRTQNQTELAEIYSAADVFVNPTREEVYGMVNAEAAACGTFVVTFDAGGSTEMLDENTGCAVQSGDIDAMEREILRVCETSIGKK